jgi:tripartite-type tricarboxylate transporter receptor subunit TctC
MRRLLEAATAILLGFACAAAHAAWPERLIRIIVPYGPGGSDAQIRLLAPDMSKLLGGQPIVVENRPGGGATVGTLAVRNSAPDGYTLLYTGTAPLTVAPHMRPLGYKLEDFAPIGNVTGTALLVVARADAPYKTVTELIAYAKANPGKVNFASNGVGTTTHIVGEVFQLAAGVNFTHVPFTGGAQQVAALLSGTSDLLIGIPSSYMPQINAGKLRGLASTGLKRSPFLPGAPSLKGEMGLDVIEETKFGLLAPKGVPAEVIAALAQALQAGVTAEDFQSKMRNGFTTPLYLNPAEFAAALAQENKYWQGMFARPEFRSLKE